MPSAFTQGILATPLPVALGGTGLSSLGSALQVIRVNAGGTALEYATVGTLSDGDKGDITVSSSGATWTIDNSAVTLAKMANITTASILGRDTAGTGVVEVLSASTVKTILALSNVEDTALSSWAGTSNITTLGLISTGTWQSDPITTGYGGTGLTGISALSIWVANSANTLTEVTATAGQSVRVNAGGTAWEAYTPSGTGDVVGPASATDNAVVVFDGTSGKLVKNSAVTISSGTIVAASVQPTAGVLAGSSSQTTTTAAAGQLFGSTSTFYQLGTGGITATLTADFNAAGTLLRQSTFTEAASGTHALIANLAIRSPIITNGAGATTNAVTLYVEGAPTGTASPTNVYSAWFDAGEVRIDGDIGDTTNRTAKVWATNIESTNMPTVGGTAILTSLTAPQFTTIELGAASDTTLSRSAAGVIAVEGVVIPSISSTNTLTNKRITPRTGTTTSSATPTINTDNVDFYSITAQTVDITSFTTNLSGTPTDGQTLWIAITGTAARAITWGASFEASTVALPTTTVSTNRLDARFVWNAVTNKWRIVGTA